MSEAFMDQHLRNETGFLRSVLSFWHKLQMFTEVSINAGSGDGLLLIKHAYAIVFLTSLDLAFILRSDFNI